MSRLSADTQLLMMTTHTRHQTALNSLFLFAYDLKPTVANVPKATQQMPRHEAKEFKFGTQLGFAKAHHKTTPRGQVGVVLSREAPIYLGFPFNISAMAVLSSLR